MKMRLRSWWLKPVVSVLFPFNAKHVPYAEGKRGGRGGEGRGDK